MAQSSADPPPVLIAKAEVWRFIHDSARSKGATEVQSVDLADLLAEADYRGHFSHGLNRLEMYIQDLKDRIISTEGEPFIAKETVATALVDGNNLLGPTVGKFAMRTAIRKAKTAGIGWVSVRHSNHFGIAGWYSTMAAREGLIGLSFTNSSPVAIPTRAKKVFLGSNPISVVAPAESPADDLALDMATSTAAYGKVEMNHRKHVPILPSWGADENGISTTDPEKVLCGGGLLPLGGTEENGGYKGYGLATMVEVFCGVLSGGDFGKNIKTWKSPEVQANYSHCVAAIDPSVFVDNFPQRMTQFSQELRAQETCGDKAVLVPGDPERRRGEACDSRGGIEYHPNLIANMDELAQQFGVRPMQRLN